MIDESLKIMSKIIYQHAYKFVNQKVNLKTVTKSKFQESDNF